MQTHEIYERRGVFTKIKKNGGNKIKMTDSKIKPYIEPSRSFPISKYGSSAIIVIDRTLRNLLNITMEDVKRGIVGLRAENIQKIYLEPKKSDTMQTKVSDFVDLGFSIGGEE